MALYFTAKEIRAPLQCGLKEIWVTKGLKQDPSTASIEQYRIQAKSAEEDVQLTEES